MKRKPPKLTLEVARLKLENAAPLDRPLVLKRLPLKDLWGYCSGDRHGFEIGIASGISRDNAVSTLVHEWAHALNWGDRSKFDHSDKWGACYAQCYRIVYGD